MQMSMSCCQMQRLEGGMTTSVFPNIERMLNDQTDYWDALQYAARRKHMDRYDSVIDFLFCETFAKYQRHCFRFYEDKGPPLRDMATPEQLDHFERALILVLDTALLSLKEQRKWCWGWITFKARAAVA